MTTSISSEARRYQKITFPPKHDGQRDIRTDGRTYGRTDISIYRVALLLKEYGKGKLEGREIKRGEGKHECNCKED